MRTEGGGLESGRLCVLAGAVAALVTALAPAAAAAATVASWGPNHAGELGDGHGFGEQNYSSVPVAVTGLTEVIAVAHGGDFNLALKGDGTVWAWGADNFGQLGDGEGGREGESRPTPVEVCDGEVAPCARHLSDVVAIAAGSTTGYALRANGEVLSWGYGMQGQLGRGYALSEVRPTRVLSGASEIGAGPNDGYAIVAGKVYSWGDDTFGQLGRAVSGADSAAPAEVPGVSEAAKVVGGGVFAAVLDERGAVRTWGSGAPEVSALTNVASIAAGWSDLVVLERNGEVLQAGGFPAESPSPRALPLPAKAIAVSATRYDAVALLEGGTPYTWGSNEPQYGSILGIGTVGVGSPSVGAPELCSGWGACAKVPVQITGLSGQVGALAAGVAAGEAGVATMLAVSDWRVSGAFAVGGALHREAAQLAGNFTGRGALHGQLSGTLSVDPSFKFAGLMLGFHITLTVPAANPTEASYEVSSLSIDGIDVATRCAASEPVDIGLSGFYVPEALSASRIDVNAVFKLPQFRCEAPGAFGSLLPFALDLLIGGEGSSLGLTIEPSGP